MVFQKKVFCSERSYIGKLRGGYVTGAYLWECNLSRDIWTYWQNSLKINRLVV